jgi:hypothetical protein
LGLERELFRSLVDIDFPVERSVKRKLEVSLIWYLKWCGPLLVVCFHEWEL